MKNDAISAPAYKVTSRMSDDDFSGVLLRLNDGRRLVVNPAGTRYAVQQCGDMNGTKVWAGRSYARLSALLAKESCGTLAALAGDLPDDPAAAAPALTDAQGQIKAQFAATDWRRQDYGRVVRQETQLRLIVEPDGETYRLQWIYYADWKGGACDNWKTICIAPDLAAIRAHMLRRVKTSDFGYSATGARVAAFLDGLPALASDGLWPALAERPEVRHG